MKQQKKGKKTNQGITLIALVVTIVVLIILATVSINAVFGENGIIQSSNNARLLSEQGTVLEDLRMEIYGKMSNPEFGEVGGLQYLQEQTGGKLREDNTIDVEKVREGIKSGRGSLDTGDVYYIENAELFYLDKEKNKKNLGQIFSDAESLNSNLEITKEVTSTPANGERYAVDEEVKYKITVTNKGTETVKNIKIEDTLTAVDIVTGEEEARWTNKEFNTLYDDKGNEIGNSLGGRQTGYIEYSYKVKTEDLGKDLKNFATVKGKKPIQKGEKPIVPVEPPEGTVILKKVVNQPDKEYTTPPDTIRGLETFQFSLYLYDSSGKKISNSDLTIKLPEGRKMTRITEWGVEYITFKLGSNEVAVIQRSQNTVNILRFMKILRFGTILFQVRVIMVGVRLSIVGSLGLSKGYGQLGWSKESLNYVSQLTVSNSMKELTLETGERSMGDYRSWYDPEGYMIKDEYPI